MILPLPSQKQRKRWENDGKDLKLSLQATLAQLVEQLICNQ